MQRLTDILAIEYPIIMAPMFLVSNVEMIVEGLNNGITAAFPALNYRTEEELRAAIRDIKSKSDKPFGVNLIVNSSNFKLDMQMRACIEEKVDYFITSLGNPKSLIEKCKPLGIKVFCDVVDLKYAQKVEALGADGVIAVNNQAGGHCGPKSQQDLLAELTEAIDIPVISAGGITNKEDVDKALSQGAAGVSVGTVFIATKESPVSDDYKNAIVKYGAKDVVLTKRLSGTPSTVINTPYVQSLGTEQNFLEWMLAKFPKLKKIVKAIIAYRGMKMVEKAAFSANYKSVWVAGPSIENVKSVSSVKEVVSRLI